MVTSRESSPMRLILFCLRPKAIPMKARNRRCLSIRKFIRTIVPGQSDDGAGLGAMTALIPSDSPVHFLLPLPPGIPDTAPELFGFYTYELRTGRAQGWSTAQGHFGSPLRVTGVQHPAPSLTCMAMHSGNGISASAAFATPVQNGRSVRQVPPATQLYVLIYAQVYQSDGLDFRNVLLSYRPAPYIPSRLQFFGGLADSLYGNATWTTNEIQQILASLTLNFGYAAELSGRRNVAG